VAINLADSITRLGHSVLLVDADLFNPSLSLMLGAPMQGHTMSTLFAELRRNPVTQLNDFVAETGVKGLSLLPGVSSLARASEIRIELFTTFLIAAAAYDYVVFDVAGDLSQTGSAAIPERLTRFLVRESHRLIAVGEANILGIDRLAKQAIDLRKLRPDRPLQFVLNRVESKRRSTVDAAELFERLTKEKVSATFPLDRRTLSAALERGCPASTIRQRGEFSKAMRAFATTLVTP
jgi:cellulose biosynthesis protein BcsQ